MNNGGLVGIWHRSISEMSRRERQVVAVMVQSQRDPVPGMANRFHEDVLLAYASATCSSLV